ncbi:hypothetical protein [Labrys monachus]|uniref:Uncharacterized protein n=1 Tax=Labrys monachus TaxID=217067 RepID=A0ABU0FC90_9HYPH|nr:hypothetical protein [Labrys monachus]MDQ0392232.1 hypothetical protein [Labrys monachus]
MSDSTEHDPPSPTEGAADVAALAAGIGAAVAATWFPVTAAVAAAAFTFAIGKFVKRGERILADRLRKGEVALLSAEKHAELVPMAYRFFEAVMQGEYEHTLEVLAAFIVGEVGEESPEAANFSRMAGRLEGISKNELRLIAHIASYVVPSANPRWVSVAAVKGPELVADLRDDGILAEGLNELSRRGFLTPKKDVDFFAKEDGFELSAAFYELVAKAGEAVSEQSGDSGRAH